MRRPPPPHAQAHFPVLTGEQAYFVVLVLERVIGAVCRAHGDALADFQGRAFPDRPLLGGDVTDCAPDFDPDAPDDEDLF